MIQKKAKPFIGTDGSARGSLFWRLKSISPFNRFLPDGAVITFPVINEGKSWDAVVTVVRREIIDSPMGEVKTVVLRPGSKYEGVLKKQGEQLL